MKTAAQLQSSLEEKKRYVKWLCNQQSMIHNRAIQAKYAIHIEKAKLDVKNLELQLEKTENVGTYAS